MKDTQRSMPNAVARLASATAKFTDFSLQINRAVQYGRAESNRQTVNIDELRRRLKYPRGLNGADVEIVVREDYNIYSCLMSMPECIKSMELTRGDRDGVIGTNRPLENTICFAIHHLDDKTLGGAYAYCANGARRK